MSRRVAVRPARAVLQLDEPVGLEEQQGAGFVGGVVGHGHHSAVLQGAKGLRLAGVDAEGFIVHGTDGYQLGALFLVEIVKIGFVLEEVGIQLLAFERHVGLHVVGVFDDLQAS